MADFRGPAIKTKRKSFLVFSLVTLAAGISVAQYWRGGPGGFRGDELVGPMIQTEGGIAVNEDTVRTARETASHSTGTPNWTNAPGFEKDVFTFARIIYKQKINSMRGWRSSAFGWANDYPDSDLNLSYRLQQMTSMKVDPDGRVLRLTDPDLFKFPFIYIVKPGRMELRNEEVPALRKYLLNGGALLADDFWGEQEWASFEHEMKRVFPERQWVELGMDHPLFHCVFDIRLPKNGLQVPPIHFFERTGGSSRNGEESKDMHVRAWLDDKKRIMMIATHNTDNGDGWEREGEETDYFHEFSEKRAYPLAMNIVFYFMTH
jgi:hypothetical protein